MVRRWSAVLEPILVGEHAPMGCHRTTRRTGEHRPNTCLLGGEQVAIYFPDSVLGRQGHRGYSQCPHGPHGRLWAAANYAGGRDMGHDRLARWHRRWAASLTWLGLGTDGVDQDLLYGAQVEIYSFGRCWGCEGNFTRSRACSRKDAKVLCARGSVDKVVTGRSAEYLDIVCTSNTGALLLVSYHDDTPTGFDLNSSNFYTEAEQVYERPPPTKK
ncbi:hypothetical protein B0H11DRAFT_1984177 [Mycena galericulata]|nr:hypothetical protein B0H11DRAFT_1984177 [Mycena galericulata]